MDDDDQQGPGETPGQAAKRARLAQNAGKVAVRAAKDIGSSARRAAQTVRSQFAGDPPAPEVPGERTELPGMTGGPSPSMGMMGSTRAQRTRSTLASADSAKAAVDSARIDANPRIVALRQRMAADDSTYAANRRKVVSGQEDQADTDPDASKTMMAAFRRGTARADSITQLRKRLRGMRPNA